MALLSTDELGGEVVAEGIDDELALGDQHDGDERTAHSSRG